MADETPLWMQHPIADTPESAAATAGAEPDAAAAGAAAWQSHPFAGEEKVQPYQETLLQKLGQTWPAQAVKSIYNAATVPGDVAGLPYSRDVATITPAVQGMWSDEDEARRLATDKAIVDRTRDLAATAAPVTPGIRAGEGAFAAPLARQEVPRAAPTAEQLHAAASGDYDVARAMDVRVKPESVQNFAAGVQQELMRKGLRASSAPKTFDALQEMQTPPAPGSIANVSDVDAMRRVFGHAARDFMNPTEQLAASRSIKALDDYARNIPDEDVISGDMKAAQKVLESARGNHAAAERADLLETKEEKAARQAASTGSGANSENAARQRYNQILNSEKQSSGFNEPEQAALNQIVTGTPVRNAARLIGKAAPTGAVSGLGSLAAYAALGPKGMVIPAAGLIAKKTGEALTQREIDALSAGTRNRSPLAQLLSTIPQYATPQNKLPLNPLVGALSAPARGAFQLPSTLTQALSGKPNQSP